MQQSDSTGAAIISLVVMLVAAYGISYWAFRARTDRSAYVGLYLLFGIPGVLLTVAGLAAWVRGERQLGPLLLATGIGLWIGLVPGVRKALAKVLPLDPTSAVDMTGLCVMLGLIGFLGGPALGGATAPPAPEAIPAISYLDLILQGAAFLLIAYLAVGWPVSRFEEVAGRPRVRTLREATERLGIVMPDPRTIGWALVATVACFVVAGIAGALAAALQPGVTDGVDEVVDAMSMSVQTVPGAIVLGLSAGIGEEAIFRGALQPRLGIVLTSVAFALLHGGQYGLNFTIVGLFLVSIVLGITRAKVNTTAAIIAHALFNALQILALALATGA